MKLKSLLIIVFYCLICSVSSSTAQDFSKVIAIVDEMENRVDNLNTSLETTELAGDKTDCLSNSVQVSDSLEFSENASMLSVSIGVDLVSRYIWRGVEFGVSGDNSFTPHFQPTASLSYNFGMYGIMSLGAWGSYGFDGNFNENDIYINYVVNSNIGSFSITFDDYYYPYLDIPFSNTEGDGLGAHTIDAQFCYTLPEVFPMSLMLSNNIYNDVPNYKSLYLEASYPFTISDNLINIFFGIAQGPSVWHSVTTDKFEFVNVGFKVTKSIKVTDDFSLPVGAAWIYNAHLKKTYLIIKITI